MVICVCRARIRVLCSESSSRCECFWVRKGKSSPGSQGKAILYISQPVYTYVRPRGNADMSSTYDSIQDREDKTARHDDKKRRRCARVYTELERYAPMTTGTPSLLPKTMLLYLCQVS